MISKYLALSFGSHLHRLAAAAATLSPPFSRVYLLKFSLLSTSTASNDTPLDFPETEKTCPISDFLLNECGLCQSQLSTALKRMPSLVVRTSIHTPEQAVQFMRDSGFTEHQVRKIITRTPSILTLIVDRQLKPMIEFLKTLGLSAEDFRNVICLEPSLLGCSLEKTVCPNIQYLQNLFGSQADVARVFKWAPRVLMTNGVEILEKRFKRLASFGILEDDIKDILRRTPVILTVSMDKVQKLMDYLIHTVGLPAEFLLEDPKLLTYSLEFRIKPRHEVLQSISAMEPSKRLPSLTSVVYLGERNFLENYVECSPHATKLLEIYRGNDNALPKD